MKVALLTSVPMAPPWDQGDKNFAYDLTRALPEETFQVLTSRRHAAPSGPNLAPSPLYTSRTPGLVEKARVFFHLLRHNGSADLYHLIFRPTGLGSSLLRRIPDLRAHPSVQTVPSITAEESAHASLFFADRVVAISQHGRDILRTAGVPDPRYIPVGVDLAAWELAPGECEAAKASLGLSGRRVIVFPGHYAPGQGAQTLLRALPALLNNRPDLTVIFACRMRSRQDFQFEARLKVEIRQAGFERSVRFLRTLQDMKPLIASSDLVVLPLEVMRDKLDVPTTLVEAMASGVPAIISDLAPMNEILHLASESNLQVGSAFPPGDANAFARAAGDVLDDVRLRAHMGAGAIRLVRDHFDIARVARAYACLYHELIA